MRPISSIPVSLPLSPAPGVLSRQKTRTRRGPGPEHPASQRAQAIKRRKAIWEALHPGGKLEVGQIGPPQDVAHGGARPQRVEFANDTAKVTGESKRDVNRHLARAEALGDDLPRVTGTSLDKGVELDF